MDQSLTGGPLIVRPVAPILTGPEIAARLRDPVRLARAGATSSDDAMDLLNGKAPKEAAVLVGILLHPEPTVLLTLRAATLNAHAGQVAFPGGRIEPGETPESAALREAAEEVGLDPRLPVLLGRLPDHLTGTGYRITPVVALLTPPFSLTPAPDEVEEPFEYPLSRLLDPMLPERGQRNFRGRDRVFWVWPHDRHLVWGATATILLNLARVLRE
ncbi:NUDIX domain-containing protein [Humitalea rosea]|uniref:NUDIX domain-containing protein n=1 Tax=Humitalea rosea TaxID=990373 RepID=A0A2W7I3I9_9PROT|nr:CoA pyrophosphatase [Humitalea rosea]PZW40022.1 NUDIX domain-containing protein [Humitalea rosea]